MIEALLRSLQDQLKPRLSWMPVKINYEIHMKRDGTYGELSMTRNRSGHRHFTVGVTGSAQVRAFYTIRSFSRGEPDATWDLADPNAPDLVEWVVKHVREDW